MRQGERKQVMIQQQHDWLAKRLLVTLRLLNSILNKIKITLDSPPPQSETNDKEREPQPQSIVVRIDSDLPPCISEYYKTEAEGRKRSKWWPRIKGVAEVVGIAAGVWYAWTSYKQWGTIERQTVAVQGQLKVMQQQFESADRPWVS